MPILQSGQSNEVTATPLAVADTLGPAQVAGLSHTVEQGKVILTWDAVTTNSDASPLVDLGGYEVLRKNEVGDVLSLVDTVAAGTETFTDTTAKDGANYIYAVRAFDTASAKNVGANSAEIAVKTVPSIPQTLTGLAQEEQVKLTWLSVKDGGDTKLNENLDGYRVYRKETAGVEGFAQITEITGDIVTYTDADVVVGTEYTYVVTAIDNGVA